MPEIDEIMNELDLRMEQESERYIEQISMPNSDPIALMTLKAAYKSGMVRAFTIMAKRGKANA